jgi:hypothetical protein
MKIFSETSVDFKISMACYSHGFFGHCRLFIILSRQIFPSDTRLHKCFPKAFQKPPVPYNAALILVTPYVGKPSHMVIHPSLQAMANGSDLNMENNIRKRDTQFISKFWLKTLENQMKYILPCILLEHTGGINLCFYMKHDLKHRKKRHNVFVRCFGTNN